MPALLAPPVRVRVAPALEPPYDDELPEPPVVAPRLTQPVLPLDWSGRHRSGPARPAPRAPAQTPGPAVATAAGAPGSTPPAVPPGQVATVRFVNACVEVLGGYRPVAHLRQLVAPAEFAAVAEQISRARERVLAAPAPPRRPTPATPSPVRVRRLRLCEPRTGVVEAAAVLGHRDRRWAFALRLECHPAGWRCTVAKTI